MKSRVGPDGVLSLTLPVGAGDANREVNVTVEPEAAAGADADHNEWARFIAQTAGSIQDPTFRRHEQGDYEAREELP